MFSKSPALTEAGKSLFIRAIGGEKVTFTRFKIGNGELDTGNDGTELFDLLNPLLDFEISNVDKSEPGYIKVTGSFDIKDIEGGFHWRELGIFAEGENGVEILYAYSNDGDDSGWLKSGESTVAEQIVSLVIAIGDAPNINVRISASALYAPKDEFDTHVGRTDNPHKVTATQVGLGKVPNVATNDQTPTFESIEDLENIKSGEKMSLLFAKIKCAISKLISHLTSSNPHNLKHTDVGAAAKTHTHSTNDITGGVLNTKRGGTGVSSEDALKRLVAPTCGFYIGNGESVRTIDIGFAPTCVLVWCQYADIRGLTSVWDGIALPDRTVLGVSPTGQPVDQIIEGGADRIQWNDYTALMLTPTGFKVGVNETYGIKTNISYTEYFYIAFGG